MDYIKHPQLLKIKHDNIINAHIKVSNIPFDYNSTWYNLGYNNTLDVVRFIVDIERQLDISIPDSEVFDNKGHMMPPIIFLNIIRYNSLDILLNDNT